VVSVMTNGALLRIRNRMFRWQRSGTISLNHDVVKSPPGIGDAACEPLEWIIREEHASQGLHDS
jgi:hypothetical protein